MRALALPRGDALLVVAGSLLLTIAYPPFHLFVPSFVCLVPAVWLIAGGEADPRPLRRHLAQGFWFGLVSNALVLYWLVVALWHFTPLSALGYAATITVLGLFHAALFAVTGWVRRRTGLGLLVILPILWTALEWTVGHLGDVRFPWLGLGTSLTRFPVAVQVADLMGARGVTYLLALANTALALAWLARRERARVVRLGGGVLVGLVLVVGYGAVRMRTLTLRPVGRVAVIQPNVGFDEKWQANGDSLVGELLRLSAQVIRETQPSLAVWPEAAVPGYFMQHPDWEQQIRAHAAETGVPLVVGGLDARRRADGWDYYNAAFVYHANGQRAPEPAYHKNYLVPMVERVPFVRPRWLTRLRWFNAAAPGAPGPVYRVPIGGFGILICYESVFEDLSRRYRRLGADFLVNVTNDAWYGRTSASYQHPAHLVMRAIETRVGIARASNDGVSEFVDPLGRERLRTPKEVQTTEAGDVYTSDARTVYVLLGDWVGWLCVVSSLALVVAARWRKP